MLASNSQSQSLIDTFHLGTRLTYKKGEFIIRPGEMPSAVFYIEKGLVKAFDITKYGEENLLIIRKDQEIFPLIWAITGQERSVIYEVLTPTEVWKISRKQYLDYLNNHPNALAPILDMTIEMYRIHSERIMTLEYRTVRERLISFLLGSAARFGREIDKGILIDVPLRHQDIASSINATRETTGRELNALVKKGMVVVDKSLIILTDKAKLKSYLS
ncbi:MAG: Crp/Fnr family transcriptional regulator [Candidatus Saccharibacteria bacterium]|nr:Crp/Fnr family transcriptional regulator [Candidatus Saccharibacteria bacterium]